MIAAFYCINRYKRHGNKLTARNDMGKLLTRAKRSPRYDWLKEPDTQALEKSLNNLDDAFQRFFKGQGRYPNFKRKHGKQSSAHRAKSLKVGERSIKIPKLSPIKAKIHWAIEGKVRSITISRTPTGKYYASILVDTPEVEAKPMTSLSLEGVVGLDMGLSHLLIDSNGHKTANPKFVKNAQANLKRKQRKLSRKKKGSASRAKAGAVGWCRAVSGVGVWRVQSNMGALSALP
jgi:putative transposase